MNASFKPLNTLNKVLYLCIVVIVFSFAFVILIRKQQGSNLGDKIDLIFNERTIEGKEIVARDLSAIYPKYYVVYTMNNTFTIQCVNYYETESQYDLEFARLLNSIIDYNKKEKMIRYTVGKGNASFDEIRQSLSYYVGSDDLVIY